MDLKTKIKNAIRRQGFTLEQVAAQMKRPDGTTGLAQSALSQMLANGNPSYNKLEEIAAIIGLSVSDLLRDGGTDKAFIVCPHCGREFAISVRSKDSQPLSDDGSKPYPKYEELPGLMAAEEPPTINEQ